jgi:hypothetical protein
MNNLKINALTLSIEFTHSIFNGGELFFKKKGEPDGQENLRFPITGKNMSINITGAMLEAVEKDHQYEIVEMGIRFAPGGEIKLPSNLGLDKLEFAADIEFLFEFGN